MGRWCKGCSIPLPHIHQRLFPFNTILQDGAKKSCCVTCEQMSTFEAMSKRVRLEALIAALQAFFYLEVTPYSLKNTCQHFWGPLLLTQPCLDHKIDDKT